MRAFGKQLLNEYLRQRINYIEKEILSEPRNQILNVNELSYIDYLVSKYKIENIALDWEGMTRSDYERSVPKSALPPNVLFGSGMIPSDQHTVLQLMVRCHVKFSGNAGLFEYLPLTSVSPLPNYQVNGDELTFEIADNPSDPTSIERELKLSKDCLTMQMNNINSELVQYNTSLEKQVSNLFKKRKAELLRQQQLLERINMPMRQSDDERLRNIIPLVKKTIIVPKPPTSNTNYQPEPAISEENYHDILEMCHRLGVGMERHPRLYCNADGSVRDEESLRDAFLLPLVLQFDSVTAETFNKKGKTDILIQHQGQNAFAAECKFWGGTKLHYETIDQILRYLTWRDSKAAILYFVKRKKLQPVIDQIRDETPKHPCFVKDAGMKCDSWFNYQFHLLTDETRNVQLAVLFFHFDEAANSSEDQ